LRGGIMNLYLVSNGVLIVSVNADNDMLAKQLASSVFKLEAAKRPYSGPDFYDTKNLEIVERE